MPNSLKYSVSSLFILVGVYLMSATPLLGFESEGSRFVKMW